jgi:hypothetical protein
MSAAAAGVARTTNSAVTLIEKQCRNEGTAPLSALTAAYN